MHETAVPSPYYANCAISRAISPRSLLRHHPQLVDGADLLLIVRQWNTHDVNVARKGIRARRCGTRAV